MSFGVGAAAAHLGAWTAAWGAALAALSSFAFGHLTSAREWCSATYGFVFAAEDLAPNLGVYWYFFTEMFDAFRPFFLFVFHAFAPFLAVPVIIRLGSDRPLFCAFVVMVLSAAFHPYPTLGDTARHVGYLPLFQRQLRGMRAGFLIASGYVFATLLSPIFWQLWIYNRWGAGRGAAPSPTLLLYPPLVFLFCRPSCSAVLLILPVLVFQRGSLQERE